MARFYVEFRAAMPMGKMVEAESEEKAIEEFKCAMHDAVDLGEFCAETREEESMKGKK